MDAPLDLEEAGEAVMDPNLTANVSTGGFDVQMTDGGCAGPRCRDRKGDGDPGVTDRQPALRMAVP